MKVSTTTNQVEVKNVCTINEESASLVVTIGLRQGCILSPVLIRIVLEGAAKESWKNHIQQYWKVYCRKLSKKRNQKWKSKDEYDANK